MSRLMRFFNGRRRCWHEFTYWGTDDGKRWHRICTKCKKAEERYDEPEDVSR